MEKTERTDKLVQKPNPEISSQIELVQYRIETVYHDLTKQNKFLAHQNEESLEIIKNLQEKLDRALVELEVVKQEREKKAALRHKRLTRTRLPKRDPITGKIYRLLIEVAEGPSYKSVRLRIALCLLAVTGVRISELRNLKVGQLSTLLNENWIAIDRLKKGPKSHKAYLTKEGKKLIQERSQDFAYMLVMKNCDSYIFTSQNRHEDILSRETLTREINNVTRQVSDQLPGQPNITSHSFRIGYISRLWKDCKDIEFVRQTIAHQSISTTSSYVQNLTDKERQIKINEL